MRLEYLQDDVSVLRDLAIEWAIEGRQNTMGIDIHQETIVVRAREWLDQTNGDIIVAWRGKVPVGLVAISSGHSMLGRQDFALEQHWYVRPGSRGVGVKLLVEAIVWAETHGCSHLIMGASRLGGMDEKVVRFYEKHNFVQFSRSFILEVT